ncbi:hypothetical protein DV735_g2359, partial [Chaetothyriales sp. CBS 134920]
MVFRQWVLRCAPGITALLLLAVVEYNLQLARSVYCYVFYNYLEPGYTPSVVSQLLFGAYSILLHLLGVYFPIRLILATRRATKAVRAAHLDARANQARTNAAEDAVLPPVTHVIVMPCYKESVETIQEALAVLASHRDAREMYCVYLAMEERDSSASAISSQMTTLYAGRFMDMKTTIHPAGLPGESAGKSSNVSWAAREVIRSYPEESVQRDVLVTVMDSDSHLLDQYFQLLRARHSENRQSQPYALYVPPIIFDRNAANVPRLVRVADLMWCSAGLSCYQTGSQGSEIIIPTSVYTLSLPLIRLADGWDAGPTAIGEDMHMMLKCYFATRGEIHIESIASPASLCNVSVSRTGLGGWLEHHWARYSQGLRHMWGALDSGYAMGLWLDMDKEAREGRRGSSSSSSSRTPRTRKLSDTRIQKLDSSHARRSQSARFSLRTLTLFSRLFEAHFLVLHLLLIIITSAAFHSLPWSSRFPYLDWTMHLTEGLRGVSFALMTVYFVFIYTSYHQTCTAVREWETKQAGIYDESAFSYRKRWSPSSLIDYLLFPVAGMMFGSLPLLQAAVCHFWTEELVYLVSAKPVKILNYSLYMAPPTKAQRKRCSAVLEAFNKRFSAVYGDERWHHTLYPALLAPTRQAALLTSPAQPPPTIKGEQVPFLSIACLEPPSQGGEPFTQPTDGSYYLLDAASVVAVQVLDVQPGHRVLDLCAAPGGKSIAIAQTPGTSVDANEFDRARFKHLEANLRHHLPAEEDRWRVTNLDGTTSGGFEDGAYDRVLVDAPCSSERHIIHAHAKKSAAGQIADEMVNWKPTASALAKTQLALLKAALRAVKVGGRVVYATCSLSPEENDGVVDKYLQTAAKQENVSEKTRYGRIILPDHPSGHRWGPIFFAVLRKVERPPN